MKVWNVKKAEGSYLVQSFCFKVRVTLISGWYVDGSGGLLFWAGVNGTSE